MSIVFCVLRVSSRDDFPVKCFTRWFYQLSVAASTTFSSRAGSMACSKQEKAREEPTWSAESMNACESSFVTDQDFPTGILLDREAQHSSQLAEASAWSPHLYPLQLPRPHAAARFYRPFLLLSHHLIQRSGRRFDQTRDGSEPWDRQHRPGHHPAVLHLQTTLVRTRLRPGPRKPLAWPHTAGASSPATSPPRRSRDPDAKRPFSHHAFAPSSCAQASVLKGASFCVCP